MHLARADACALACPSTINTVAEFAQYVLKDEITASHPLSLVCSGSCESHLVYYYQIRTIWRWLTHKVRFDITTFLKNGRAQQLISPDEVLANGAATAGNLAILFKALCDAVWNHIAYHHQ